MILTWENGGTPRKTPHNATLCNKNPTGTALGNKIFVISCPVTILELRKGGKKDREKEIRNKRGRLVVNGSRYFSKTGFSSTRTGGQFIDH
jgi:hypothetical protein